MGFALIADAHYFHKDVGTKLGTQAAPLLRQTFQHCCNALRTDKPLIINMGDLITNCRDGDIKMRAAEDLANMDAAMGLMHECNILHHTPGNHDVENLSPKQVWALAQKHGVSVTSTVLQHEGLSIVLWTPDPSIRPERGGTIAISNKNLAWLASALDRIEGPAIVCTHIPLDGGWSDYTCSQADQRINPVFGKGVSIRYATHYPNSDAAHRIMTRSGKVVACIGAHTHWNEINLGYDGLPHVTIPSLTEKFGEIDGRPVAWESYAVIDYNKYRRQLTIDVRGRAPVTYRISDYGVDLTV